MRITIGKKLVASFLVIAILIGISSFLSYTSLQKVDQSYSRIIDRDATMRFNAISIQLHVAQQTSNVRGFLLTADPANLEAYIQSNEKVQQLVEESLQFQGLDEKIQQQLALLSTLNESYKGSTDSVLEFAKDDKVTATMLATNQVFPIENDMMEIADTLVQSQATTIQDHIAENGAFTQSTYRIQLILSVGAVILALIIGLTISRLISKPLGELSKASKRIAEGDLTGEDLKVKTRDEIRELAESFNQMKSNLHQLIRHVGDSVHQVTSSTEELMASSEQSSKATEQITIASQEVATGAENQVKSAQETVGIVNEISKGMNQVAAAIQSVADATSNANQEAFNGNQVLNETIKQMNVVQEKVESTAVVIDNLGEKSKEIGQIVTLITDVAAQTNLLALNAAIEAARAGEHGRGFAVVADEVRKLAEQSRDAAEKIGNLITEIQNESQNAIYAMNEGTQAVEDGMGHVHHTGESFKTITKMIEEVSVQSQEVSAIVEEVSASSSSMVEMIDAIAHISEQSASNTQYMASASEEQLASMEEISSSATSLAEMAEDLKRVINQFKL
ncbi:methyl-accepting chemotaxis protein [Ammoniphilus resinae]|uniref:Methyl-accepting chemotaxis protein n=1 Tax=Ammoniphilus resinae TaxID=861532 RepID=A0ABS4GQL0_9BACL|nr:methyl-accepting chemotaxis protein [Ammoniphilus resinae]MBP1932555.1 methyl-accepting chemotaxis protein [Ammoniphilus resinae]